MPRKKTKTRWRGWSTRSRFSKPVDMPDVGSWVKEELYEIKISIPSLAKRLNVSADRAYRLLRRKDWKVSEIMNISAIIGWNVFDWYAEQTQPAETPVAAPVTTVSADAELQLLRQKTAVLEAENKLLREMMEIMKGK